MQLLAWWNLIFELPFLVAFVLVLVIATGTVPMGDGGHDAHVGHAVGMGHDVSHDAHVGHVAGMGHAVGHDLHHDVGHAVGHAAGHAAGQVGGHAAGQVGGHAAGQAGAQAAHAEHQGNWNWTQLLAALGIGQVPMALIFMSLSVIWGFIGWTSNQLLGEILKSPTLFVPISVVAAFIGSLVFTRYVALGFARLIPSVETYGVTRSRLLGKTAQARYPISETFGEAFVHDRYGQLHQVSCRTLPGKETIPAGSDVVLYQFDSDQDVFYVVTPLQLEILTSQYVSKLEKES